MKLCFFQLPGNILSLIYQYDGTYRSILSNMMDMIIWDKMVKRYIACLNGREYMGCCLVEIRQYIDYCKDTIYKAVFVIRKRFLVHTFPYFHVCNLLIRCEEREEDRREDRDHGFRLKIELINREKKYKPERHLLYNKACINKKIPIPFIGFLRYPAWNCYRCDKYEV